MERILNTMKGITMSGEPVSGAATAAAGWKLIGGLAGMGAIGAGLAALVVMCMTRPKTDQEWVVALVSTFVSSLGGTAGTVVYFKLQFLVEDVFGLLSLGGLFFSWGIPGWFLIRAAFAYMANREGKDLLEVVKEVKESI
jgi:hypothetical protein